MDKEIMTIVALLSFICFFLFMLLLFKKEEKSLFWISLFFCLFAAGIAICFLNM